ncbi:hypothetical protein BJP34_11835 [Moorena producens PAL-8-15-08-1]|uniref:Uncharacterized protein n=1 Tax=Moorena producens PAL-8-15-08-1 TaxID=1458985 RepID=A0A1D8TRJ5_9CYAN|nr:hypothetical protein [Moorena producens]AOX00056.1 hypothetical protein BJP34_11835 [Moorena producens PAL-8-15-08-1]
MTINRRTILQIAAVGGLGTVAASSLIRPGSSKELIAAARDPWDKRIPSRSSRGSAKVLVY